MCCPSFELKSDKNAYLFNLCCITFSVSFLKGFQVLFPMEMWLHFKVFSVFLLEFRCHCTFEKHAFSYGFYRCSATFTFFQNNQVGRFLICLLCPCSWYSDHPLLLNLWRHSDCLFWSFWALSWKKLHEKTHRKKRRKKGPRVVMGSPGEFRKLQLWRGGSPN